MGPCIWPVKCFSSVLAGNEFEVMCLCCLLCYQLSKFQLLDSNFGSDVLQSSHLKFLKCYVGSFAFFFLIVLPYNDFHLSTYHEWVLVFGL